MKYEQKRKGFKEQEAAYQRQLTEAQKERAVLEEKVASGDTQREEMRVKMEGEVLSLKEQLQAAGEQVARERELYASESERNKQALQEMERELSEVQSSYERDKALWEGKFSFLEQQKEQAKSDLAEASKKFEMTLEQLQRRGNAEKDKIENSQNALLGSLESKYRAQMKE